MKRGILRRRFERSKTMNEPLAQWASDLLDTFSQEQIDALLREIARRASEEHGRRVRARET